MGPTMRALLCDNGLRYDSAYPDPMPPPGEALIRVRLAGICNTDLELLRGYLGFRGVLGHEFVGEVVQATDASWLGQRVVGDINAACRSQDCAACAAGRHTHCPNRTTLGIAGRDGAFADYLAMPQANLLPVPDHVSDELAVFTEPLAAACEILAQIRIAPTDRVVVLGDGKLGLLVAAVLRLTGAELILVGRNRNKLAIAEGWGVQVLPAGEPLPAQAADVVVECTGSPQGFEFARHLLRPRGTLVLKSTYHGALSVDMSGLVVDEITLLGSRCGPFAPALRLLASGLVDPRGLISETFALDQAAAAFARAGAPGVLKVLLAP
jgi:threonine dehydrogenase-like Zn-dependent dehydrogenase